MADRRRPGYLDRLLQAAPQAGGTAAHAPRQIAWRPTVRVPDTDEPAPVAVTPARARVAPPRPPQDEPVEQPAPRRTPPVERTDDEPAPARPVAPLRLVPPPPEPTAPEARTTTHPEPREPARRTDAPPDPAPARPRQPLADRPSRDTRPAGRPVVELPVGLPADLDARVTRAFERLMTRSLPAGRPVATAARPPDPAPRPARAVTPVVEARSPVRPAARTERREGPQVQVGTIEVTITPPPPQPTPAPAPVRPPVAPVVQPVGRLSRQPVPYGFGQG